MFSRWSSRILRTYTPVFRRRTSRFPLSILALPLLGSYGFTGMSMSTAPSPLQSEIPEDVIVPATNGMPLAVCKEAISSDDSKPIFVLVHGLDSAKDTWSGVMEELRRCGHPFLAVDLRGHGESAMGDPAAFSRSQLALDLKITLLYHGITKPVILVGHSMGGRVVMDYASLYPEDILHLVIEDMDVKQRTRSVSPDFKQRMGTFHRQFESVAACKAALTQFNYADDRIEGWFKSGRIFSKLTSEGPMVWSSINPMAKYLAINHILNSDGRAVWRHLMTQLGRQTHVWVADDKHTVCDADVVEYMRGMIPAENFKKFPGAWHSIHRNRLKRFMEELKKLASQGSQ